MVATQEILAGLSPAKADLAEASGRIAAAVAHARAVRENVLDHGWDGVATGMDGVIVHFQNAHTAADAAVGTVELAETPVTEITDKMSPEEVEERLRTAAEKAEETSGSVEATYDALDEAKDDVERVLRGGDPGPLLSMIDDVRVTLNAARGGLDTAKAKTATELVEVAKAGNR